MLYTHISLIVLWNRRHRTIIFHPVRFYFVKVVLAGIDGNHGDFSLNIHRHNGSEYNVVPKSNLFWILPGKTCIHIISLTILNAIVGLLHVTGILLSP